MDLTNVWDPLPHLARWEIFYHKRYHFTNAVWHVRSNELSRISQSLAQ